MEIKLYRPEDLTEMLKLFCNTVHTVNAKDYTPQQQDAWTPDSVVEGETNPRTLGQNPLRASEPCCMAGWTNRWI